MPPIEAEINGEQNLQPIPSANTSNEPAVPDWVNEDHFIDIFKEQIDGFKNILDFDVQPTGGGGENYASILLRVKAKLELEGDATKDIAFMVKTLPSSAQTAMIVAMMDLFRKETTMYGRHLPEFEKLYSDAGKQVSFGPKFHSLKKDPGTEHVILEDLGPLGFKNVNRLEGLDKEHIEAVLELLAKLHAASAVRYETKGAYDECFKEGIFSEKSRPIFESMMKPLKQCQYDSIKKLKNSEMYLDKVEKCLDSMIDSMLSLNNPRPDEFNVLNHGDLWANNIMFRHNDEGKLMETLFVDYQVCRYSSPVGDLYYFLLSSSNFDLKLSHFDYFVKFYHDHLVENLVLLNYPKRIPLLKELRMQMIDQSYWAFSTLVSVLPVILLDPTKDANMDNFVNEGEAGDRFRMLMYHNPRYMKQMEVILPWLVTLGLLG